MDSKDTWPLVKFLIAATGLKRKDARNIIDEIPPEKHSQLFIEARAWDRDQQGTASKALAKIIGDDKLGTLIMATRRARVAMGPVEPDEEGVGDEPEPKKAPRRKKR